MTQTSPSVKYRQVFYIPGYDPHPPRRYRELYRKEGPEQAKISGYRLAVRSAEKSPGVWQVGAEIDGTRVQSEVEVLVWSDIVAETMGHSIPRTYLQLAKVAIVYIGSGALRRLMWLRKGPILAGFYPVLMLLAQLIGAMIAGKIAAVLITGLLTLIVDKALGLFLTDPAGTSTWGWIDWTLGWAIFAGMVFGLLTWFKSKDGRIFAHYLMHDLAYTVRRNGAYPAELDARIDAFADKIGEALKGQADEVLIVGHSSGAQLAVSAMARLLRAGRVPENGPAFSLLTLGQAIPMVSFLPGAKALRRDLHDLSGEERITWVDFSAPGDGCSFALCDPVGVTGVAAEKQRWPLVLSAAYSQTMSEKMQEELKHKYFRLHFQYLCAFDRPGDYDYFRITAGPFTLGERFAERKPSMNRIDVPASRFRSMAA